MTTNENQINTIISQLKIDLNLVLNQTSITNFSGNDEIAAASKRLIGLTSQPKSLNVSQYRVAKGQLLLQGATPEAASALALLAANIAKSLNVSITNVVNSLRGSNLNFDSSILLALNRSKEGDSRNLRFTSGSIFTTFSRNVHVYISKPTI